MIIPLDAQVEHWGQQVQKFRINENQIPSLLASGLQSSTRQQLAIFDSNGLMGDSTNLILDDSDGRHGVVYNLTDQNDPSMEYTYGKFVFQPLSDSVPTLPDDDLTPNFVEAAKAAFKSLFGDATYLSFGYTPIAMVLHRLFDLGFDTGVVSLDKTAGTFHIECTDHGYQIILEINRPQIEAYLNAGETIVE